MTFLLILDFTLSFVLGVFIVINRRLRRESRRAVPNHSDPRPSTHPILGPVLTEPDEGTVTSEDARADPRVIDEPIRAWKRAKVTREADGKLTFNGMSYGKYGVEAVAKCEVNALYPTLMSSHPAPDESCTCGFYAVKERPTPVAGYAVLEVELYGKVIPHKLGYRAEKQRVLSVTAVPSCEHQVTREVSSGLHSYPAMVPCDRKAPFTADGIALCSEHALKHPKRFFEWQPEPVNCETEWRWAE